MTPNPSLPFRTRPGFLPEPPSQLHFDEDDLEDGARTPTASSSDGQHQRAATPDDWSVFNDDDHASFEELSTTTAHVDRSQLATQTSGNPAPIRPMPAWVWRSQSQDTHTNSDREGDALDLQRHDMDLLPNANDHELLPLRQSPTRPTLEDQDLSSPRSAWLTLKEKAARHKTRQQDTHVDELSLRLSNEFEPVKEDDWDTVLYIGPPSQQYGQSEDEYRCIQARFSTPHLMKSETLQRTGSSEFLKRLGPMSARAARKLKNLGLHHNLPQDGNPKYWIDLRPMQNDEEALLMVAELTCTPGILSWYKAASTRGVDRSLVCGRDDVDMASNPFMELIKRHEGVKQTLLASPGNPQVTDSDHGGGSASAEPQHLADEGPEPEYSPIRHHVAIERLLHAIVGNSPRLNSAPKMWNFFAIAKFFDCATLPRVCDEVHSWIFAGYNCDFIEMNPEICYRIALGTQSRLLLRITFSILVGEKALDQAMKAHSSNNSTINSPNLNRAFCHLDDDEVNRIDHAAQSLQRRMRNTVHEIFNMPLTWMSQSSELMKLFALIGTSEESQEQLNQAWALLHEYVRKEMVLGLSHNLAVSKQSGAAFITLPGAAPKGRTFVGSQVTRYNALPVHHRLLTQLGWWYIHGWGLNQNFVTPLELILGQHDGINQVCPDFRDEPFFAPGAQPISTALATINAGIDHGSMAYPVDKPDSKAPSKYFSFKESTSWQQIYLALQAKLPAIAAQLPETESNALVKAIHERLNLYSSDGTQKTLFRDADTLYKPLPSERAAINYTFTYATISQSLLIDQLSESLRRTIMTRVLRAGYIADAQGIEADVPTEHIDTLLCLNDEEFKFLPLWADGCDDGTGGVFTEVIPGTEEEFSGGKRGLGLEGGLDGLDDIEFGEEAFTMIGSEEIESTVARASKVATDGAGTASILSMEE